MAFNHRATKAYMLANVAAKRKLAVTYNDLGYYNAAKKMIKEAKFTLAILSQHREKGVWLK